MGRGTVDALPPGSDVEIGAWRVLRASNEIRRGADRLHLEPKVMDVLLFLASRAGRVVTREELLEGLWPGVVVGDEALTQSINKARKALGDEAHQPQYIETIAKRGYRLIAPVVPVAPARARVSLRTAIAAAVAVVALAASVLLLSWMRSSEEAIRGQRSAPPLLAVLPFSNLSGDPKRDYFSDGVSQDIINALGRFSTMRVVSRASVDRLESPPALAAMRKQLGARYLLTGSVREADGKLRVAVELSDAEKGAVRWSERYEGEGRDLFKIQDEIVRHIVGALEVKVTRLELARAAAKPPENLEAYDAVLRARALVEAPDRAANRQARELLAKAVRLAPDYAEAWVVSSNAEVLRSIFGWTETPAESLRVAEEHARRALALDDSGAHSRAHGLLGVIYSIQQRFDDSLEQADRAIALNPSDAFAYDTRGQTLLWLGRFEEAIASLDTASRYNPAVRSAASGFNRALAHFMLDQPRKALAAADDTLGRFPEASFVHAIRAAALAQLGRTEEARGAAETTRRLDPFFQDAEFGTRFVDRAHHQKLRGGLRQAGL